MDRVVGRLLGVADLDVVVRLVDRDGARVAVRVVAGRAGLLVGGVIT